MSEQEEAWLWSEFKRAPRDGDRRVSAFPGRGVSEKPLVVTLTHLSQDAAEGPAGLGPALDARNKDETCTVPLTKEFMVYLGRLSGEWTRGALITETTATTSLSGSTAHKRDVVTRVPPH